MTTFILTYTDDTHRTLTATDLTILSDKPSAAPTGSYTHYVDPGYRNRRLLKVEARLGSGDPSAAIIIQLPSAAVEQRAAVATPAGSAIWGESKWTLVTIAGSSHPRLDVSLSASATQVVYLTDNSQPPVALKVVVVRP